MAGQDQRYPEWWRRRFIYKRAYIHLWRGQLVARSWPKDRGPPVSEAQAKTQNDFKKLVAAGKLVYPVDQVGARLIAGNSQYIYRDVISRALVGRLLEMTVVGIEEYDVISIQTQLDSIGNTPGSLLARAPSQWVIIVNPANEPVLIWDPVAQMPVWGSLPDTGITQLTGDGTAGPGTGSQVLTLANTGVVPGTYTNATMQVDAAGRVHAASSGAAAAGITQLTGDGTAGPGSGSQALTLSNTGVTPGTYTNATMQVDAAGRVHAASTGATPNGITELVGDATAGPGSGIQAITLADTGVLPGSYVRTNLTVDSKGLITAAADGAADAGITQLTGDGTAGPGNGSQALTLSATGVTPGIYTFATVNVNAAGRITAAASGVVPPIPTPSELVIGWQPSRYYAAHNAANTLGFAANRLFATPMPVPLAETIGHAGLVVQTAVAASEVTVGVYANNNGYPGALIGVLGIILTATNGVKTIVSTSLPITGPLVWIACATSHAPTLGAVAAEAIFTPPNIGASAPVTAPSTSSGFSAARTYTTGVLPATFPAGASYTNGTPAIWIGQ